MAVGGVETHPSLWHLDTVGRVAGRQIGDRIAQQTGQKIDLSASVEPDIIGGIIVRVGNSILDASIRNRLEQLRKQVARA